MFDLKDRCGLGRLCLFVCLLFLMGTEITRSETQRPHFLVILCDDLGWGDLGCFGHPHIETKNLDQLAAEGLRLTSCYSAAPVCSPSRTGLLTGRSPNRAGIFDWIPEANEKTRANSKNGRHLVHLRDQELTLPSLLRKAGYSTAMAGKWHCNSQFNSPEQPQPGNAGFDHWFATQNNAGPSHENPRNFVRNGKPVGALEGFSCQLVADEAIQWLERTQPNSTNPFFLYVAFHEPHEPVQSPKHLVDKYLSVAANEDEAQYFANVHNMDLAVGRLLEALDRMKLAENTIVYFSSDNGPETLLRYPAGKRSYGRPGTLRGMKLWTTEAGFRVPGIVRWPGKAKAGSVIAEPISSLDLLPTFAFLAKATLPEQELDGMNVESTWRGQSIPRDKPLFWFYYNALNEQRAAMRHGKWKLLAKFNGGKLPKFENISESNVEVIRSAELTDFSLYDLDVDAGEQHDLASSHPDELASLSGKMRDLYRDVVKSMHVWRDR
jgi:arylsulfatase A